MNIIFIFTCIISSFIRMNESLCVSMYVYIHGYDGYVCVSILIILYSSVLLSSSLLIICFNNDFNNLQSLLSCSFNNFMLICY